MTSVLLHFLATGVALCIAWAGYLKLADQEEFRNTLVAILGSYGIAKFLAPVLPILEIVGGMLTLAGSTFGIILLSGLLLLFVIVAFFVLARGEKIRCNCFGGTSELISKGTIGRNLVLLALLGGQLCVADITIFQTVMISVFAMSVVCIVATFKQLGECKTLMLK